MVIDINFVVLRQLINPEVKIITVENTPDDPRQRKPDITKAKELLGWEPKIKLRDGIPLMEEDFRGRLGISRKKWTVLYMVESDGKWEFKKYRCFASFTSFYTVFSNFVVLLSSEWRINYRQCAFLLLLIIIHVLSSNILFHVVFAWYMVGFLFTLMI